MALLLISLVACTTDTSDVQTPRRDAIREDTALADTAGEDTAECEVAWRYRDADGDGFGDPILAMEACETVGYVDNGNDCDDGEHEARPGAAEVCDAIDNNCDGSVDEGVRWYPDGDGDGYGTGGGSCDATGGTTHLPDDCDDEDATRNPGVSDRDNAVDDDCDGLVDEETDHDGDGYSQEQGDCDDSSAHVYPRAPETCDGVDEDCDDLVDDLEHGGECP